MTEQEIEKRLKELRHVFERHVTPGRLEIEISYDKDCPSFEVFNFSICPPSEDDSEPYWLVLAWTYSPGSYYEPPDVWETELGKFAQFHEAVKCVWMAKTEQELEARWEWMPREPEFEPCF